MKKLILCGLLMGTFATAHITELGAAGRCSMVGSFARLGRSVFAGLMGGLAKATTAESSSMEIFCNEKKVAGQYFDNYRGADARTFQEEAQIYLDEYIKGRKNIPGRMYKIVATSSKTFHTEITLTLYPSRVEGDQAPAAFAGYDAV